MAADTPPRPKVLNSLESGESIFHKATIFPEHFAVCTKGWIVTADFSA